MLHTRIAPRRKVGWKVLIWGDLGLPTCCPRVPTCCLRQGVTAFDISAPGVLGRAPGGPRRRPPKCTRACVASLLCTPLKHLPTKFWVAPALLRLVLDGGHPAPRELVGEGGGGRRGDVWGASKWGARAWVHGMHWVAWERVWMAPIKSRAGGEVRQPTTTEADDSRLRQRLLHFRTSSI